MVRHSPLEWYSFLSHLDVMSQHLMAGCAAASRASSVAQFLEVLNSPGVNRVNYGFFRNIQAPTNDGFLTITTS